MNELKQPEGKILGSDKSIITHIKEFPPELEKGLAKIIPGGKFEPDENMRRDGRSIFGLAITLPGWKSQKFMVQWDERIEKAPSRSVDYKDIGIKPVYHIMTLWTNKAAEAEDHPLKGKEDWFPTKDFEGGTELESSKRVIQYLKSKVKRMT